MVVASRVLQNIERYLGSEDCDKSVAQQALRQLRTDKKNKTAMGQEWHVDRNNDNLQHVMDGM